jgi:hypothetical protein
MKSPFEEIYAVQEVGKALESLCADAPLVKRVRHASVYLGLVLKRELGRLASAEVVESGKAVAMLGQEEIEKNPAHSAFLVRSVITSILVEYGRQQGLDSLAFPSVGYKSLVAPAAQGLGE